MCGDCIKGEERQRDIANPDEKEALEHDIHRFVRSHLLPCRCSNSKSECLDVENTSVGPHSPKALSLNLKMSEKESRKVWTSVVGEASVSSSHATEGVQYVEPDDFVAPMSIETYVEYRLKYLLRRSQQQTPQLARLLNWFELLGIIFTSIGALLVVLKKNLWVTFSVSLATGFSNIMQHQMLQPRMGSHNSAIQILQAQITFLDSLSIVQRRTLRVKTQCVMVTEMAVLHTITVWTGVSIAVGSHHGGPNEEEEEPTDKKDK